MELIFGLLTTSLIPAYFLVLHKKKEMTVSLKTNIILCIISFVLQLALWFIVSEEINSLIFLIPYLIVQSYTDAKTQYVYRFPSYIFGIMGIILLFVFKVRLPISIWISAGIVTLFCIMFGVTKMFGLGDSISLIVLIPYILIFSGSAFLVVYLLMFIIGCISFAVSHVFKKRGAFIPHLSIGFLLTILLLLLGGVIH